MGYMSLARERERKRGRPRLPLINSVRKIDANTPSTHLHLAPTLRPADSSSNTRLDSESRLAYVFAIDAAEPNGSIGKVYGETAAKELLEALTRPSFLELLGKLSPNVTLPLLKFVSETSYDPKALVSEQALASLAPRLAKLSEMGVNSTVVDFTLRSVAANYPEVLSESDFDAKARQHQLKYG